MTTNVLIDLGHLSGDDAQGFVDVVYSRRIYPADPSSRVIVEYKHRVPLEDGKATVPVPPSGVDGYYTWTEHMFGGITRYTSVPDVAEVDYRDLVDVDPATFLPTADPEAAWWATANGTVVSGAVVGDDLILTQYDGSLINAGNVRGPQGNSGPANQLAIGAVTTLAAGESATATITGVYPNQVLNLGIPEGDPGPAGATLLSALTDVDLTGLADGDALVYDLATGKWKRVALTSTYVAQADAPELIRDTMGTALVAGANVTITPDDGADTITISAAGGAAPCPTIIPTGQYDYKPLAAGTIKNVGIYNYLLGAYGSSYPVPSVTIATVGIYVNTAGAAGETVKLGVYDSNPSTGLPTGAPILTSNIDVSTTGYKDATLNHAFTGGRIWVFVAALALGGTATYASPDPYANAWWMPQDAVGRWFAARIPISAGTFPTNPVINAWTLSSGANCPGFRLGA